MPGLEGQWAGRPGLGCVVKKESVHMQGVAAVLPQHGQRTVEGPVCSPPKQRGFPFEGRCTERAAGGESRSLRSRRAYQHTGGLCGLQLCGLDLGGQRRLLAGLVLTSSTWLLVACAQSAPDSDPDLRSSFSSRRRNFLNGLWTRMLTVQAVLPFYCGTLTRGSMTKEDLLAGPAGWTLVSLSV